MLALSLYELDTQLEEMLEWREDAEASLNALENNHSLEADINRAELEGEIKTLDFEIRRYYGELATKVDSVAGAWLHRQTMIESGEAELLVLKARVEGNRKRLESIKTMVKFAMEGMTWKAGKPRKLEGARRTIYLKGNGGKPAVEIPNADLVPEEFQRYSVEMSGPVWEQIWKTMGPQWMKENVARVSREPSLSLIADALTRNCPSCLGAGSLPATEATDSCRICGGTGKQSVAGCNLAVRGEHVECH